MEITPTDAANPPASTAQIGLLLSFESDFAPTLTLGSNLPKTRNGFDCHYRDKESLKPAKLTDAKGNQWNLTPTVMDEIIHDINRALSLGHEPPIQDDHYKPTKNFGWIKGVKKNSHGGIDLLHQFLGEKARDEALTRKTSIMLMPNFTDEKGNKYKWFLDHQASVLRPQFRDLEDFKQPALAASNGQPVEAVSLTLAEAEALPQEDIMDLSQLRASLGDKAKDQPDDQLLALAAKELTDSRTALALSAQSLKDQTEANSVLVGELNAAEAARDNALALAAPEANDPPNPQVLALSGKLSEMSISLALKENKINDKQAESLRSRIKTTPALALSADETSGTTPIDDLIAFAALGADDPKAIKPIVRGTPAKPLALGAEPEAGPMTPERKKELLSLAGY